MGSTGRNSVKELIMQFNGGMASKDSEPLKVAAKKNRQLDNKKFDQGSRKSLGDAFM